eukprot:symbB.v1.2.038730.t1/scaffold6148.1/size20549/1
MAAEQIAKLHQYDELLQGLTSGQCSLETAEVGLKDFEDVLAQVRAAAPETEWQHWQQQLDLHRRAVQNCRGTGQREELLGEGARKRKALKAKTQAEAEHSEVLELKSARDEMRSQLERMHYVNENLQDSSRTIGKTKDALQDPTPWDN